MKKAKAIAFIGVMMMSTLTGCDQTELNNLLPMKEVSVSVDYGNLVADKATTILSEDLDISQEKLLNKNKPSKKVKNLLAGDKLEVYYTNDNYDQIDHILVEAVDELVVSVTNAAIPGSGDMDIFVENAHIVILHQNIFNIINSDGTFDKLKNAEYFLELYGTYKESDCSYDDVTENKIITLTALYSYKPRTL